MWHRNQDHESNVSQVEWRNGTQQSSSRTVSKDKHSKTLIIKLKCTETNENFDSTFKYLSAQNVHHSKLITKIVDNLKGAPKERLTNSQYTGWRSEISKNTTSRNNVK